jgi:hypothetical protein
MFKYFKHVRANRVYRQSGDKIEFYSKFYDGEYRPSEWYKSTFLKIDSNEFVSISYKEARETIRKNYSRLI